MNIVTPRHMRLALVGTLGLLLVGAAGTVAAAPSVNQTYTLTDLNRGGDSLANGGARAINAHGQVLAMVGRSFRAGPGVWQSGVGWTFFGTDLFPVPGAGSFYAGVHGRAFNNHGAMVGSVLEVTAGGLIVSHAFLRQAAGLSFLRLPAGPINSDALGINDRNQVVGTVSVGLSTPSRAVLWEPDGSPRELGMLPGTTTSTAIAINARGEVVGSSGNHAFMWDGAHGMQDLGTLPGATTSTASAINTLGRVVGTSGDHAFMWDGVHGMQDLGTLPGATTSTASGINDHNQIVGASPAITADPVNIGNGRAFVWDTRHGMHDLGVLVAGYTSSASAINNSGQIVGVARKPDPADTFTAVLWQPLSQGAAAATD